MSPTRRRLHLFVIVSMLAIASIGVFMDMQARWNEGSLSGPFPMSSKH